MFDLFSNKLNYILLISLLRIVLLIAWVADSYQATYNKFSTENWNLFNGNSK